jgi:hypothetical protein
MGPIIGPILTTVTVVISVTMETKVSSLPGLNNANDDVK